MGSAWKPGSDRCWVPQNALSSGGRVQDEVRSLKPGEVRERTPARPPARSLSPRRFAPTPGFAPRSGGREAPSSTGSKGPNAVRQLLAKCVETRHPTVTVNMWCGMLGAALLAWSQTLLNSSPKAWQVWGFMPAAQYALMVAGCGVKGAAGV